MLHPLTIMIGLFTSRLLWGIVGMVLSIPLLGSLKTTLAGAFEPWSGSAPDDKVGFLLFREVVKGVLDTAPSAGAFLRGGVTFCDMLPMRSVPFRVVILLGMDDGVFPRADARAAMEARLNARLAKKASPAKAAPAPKPAPAPVKAAPAPAESSDSSSSDDDEPVTRRRRTPKCD